jgi:hypothetical protein
MKTIFTVPICYELNTNELLIAKFQLWCFHTYYYSDNACKQQLSHIVTSNVRHRNSIRMYLHSSPAYRQDESWTKTACQKSKTTHS